ncbi:MAG: CARDB domain-containing protein, partial [Pseudomonadota bacterium]
TLDNADYEVVAVIDSADAVAEADETNNRDVGPETITQNLPNLTFGDPLVAGPAGAGGLAVIDANPAFVTNDGTAASTPTQARIRLVEDFGGSIIRVTIATVDLPALAPGENAALDRIEFEFPAGFTSAAFYEIEIDFDRDVVEFDEQDNDQTLAGIFADGVDGAVDAVTLDRATVDAGAAVDVTVEAVLGLDQLAGEDLPLPGQDFEITVSNGVDVRTIATRQTPDILSDGQTAAFVVQLPDDLAAGTWTLTGDLDADDSLAETDEGNNAASTTFEVVAPRSNLVPELVQINAATLSNADAAAGIVNTYAVANEGPGDAGASQATLALVPTGGGEPALEQTVDVPALASGERFEFTATFDVPPSLTPGSYVWRLTVDSGDAVAESDEGDDAADSSQTLTMTDAPEDLVAVAISTAAAGPLAAGETFDVDWSAANEAGFLVSGEVMIALITLDGNQTVELARETVENLANGDGVSRTTSVTVPAAIPLGGYRLTLIVDPDDALAEQNESNNRSQASGQLDVVGPPNGAASDLAIVDVTLEAGDLIEFDWLLSNDGTTDLPDTDFRAEIEPAAGGGATEIQRRNAGAVEDGAAITVEEQLTLDGGLSAGDYILRVIFDPDDVVAETDETDNVLEAAFQIVQSEQFSNGRDVVKLTEPGRADAGQGDDEVRGGGWDDLIFGQVGDDALFGFGGRDQLRGGPGDDDHFGGNGRDDVKGGKGDDFADGGKGGDVLQGERGADELDGGPG